jgi:hypothetical protein
MVEEPTSIAAGGAPQGYHIAPVRAGPSASAGTSMSWKPAARAIVAAMEHKAITTTNLTACIVGLFGDAGDTR